MDEKDVKQKLVENGHDFDAFLKDLKVYGQVPLKRKYPFFSHNAFTYLKGMYGFTLNCRGASYTKFDIKPDNRWNVHLPRQWKTLLKTEKVRELVHQYLVNKGFDENLGVRR